MQWLCGAALQLDAKRVELCVRVIYFVIAWIAFFCHTKRKIDMMRSVDTPDLQTTSTCLKLSVDRYFEDKNTFEPVDVTVNECEAIVSGIGYKLFVMKELSLPDEYSIGLVFPGAAIHLRFPSILQRNDAHQEVKRLLQVAMENRLIEEAEEVLADFEEQRVNSF